MLYVPFGTERFQKSTNLCLVQSFQCNATFQVASFQSNNVTANHACITNTNPNLNPPPLPHSQCCSTYDHNRSAPGCKTRTVQTPGPHEPTLASLARAKQIAAVGAAEHARREAAAKAERAKRIAAEQAERRRIETEKRKAAARLELRDELQTLRQQHQHALDTERARSNHLAATALEHQQQLASQEQLHAALVASTQEACQSQLAASTEQHAAAVQVLRQELAAAKSLHAHQLAALHTEASTRAPAAAVDGLQRARHARAGANVSTEPGSNRIHRLHRLASPPPPPAPTADPALSDGVAALHAMQQEAAARFQVPTSLEAALAAADAAQAQLEHCNATIADACAAGADEASLAEPVANRDAARIDYVDAAAAFQSEYAAGATAEATAKASSVVNHFGMLTTHLASNDHDHQHANPDSLPADIASPAALARETIAAVDAWRNAASSKQSAAAEQTEKASDVLSLALSALAWDAAGFSPTAPPLGDAIISTAAITTSLQQVDMPRIAVAGALETACLALNHAAQLEAEANLAAIATFPVATVAAAVQWVASASLEATYRFETIYSATVHHAAAADGVAEWIDPAAKAELLASLDKAQASKLDAIDDLEENAFKLKRAERRLEKSEDEANCKSIAIKYQTAKRELARATTHNLQLQSKLSGVMRDHFPELSINSVATKDPLLGLLGDLGGLPTYDSLDHYDLGTRLRTTGTHEMHVATYVTDSGGGGGNDEDDDADLSNGDAVVLKRFPLDDEKSRKTFEKELRIMARLRHPNVVRLTGVVFDTENATAHLEMPFMQHGDLRKYLEHNPSRRAEAEVQQMFADLMKALEYLHANGVVHLDVKPDNILIAAHGTAKLSDFDVSKDAAARTVAVGTVAATTMVVSGLTLGYAAPEVLEVASLQSRGGGAAASGGDNSSSSSNARPTVGPGADVWSAGCVLFFMSFYPSEVTVEMGSEPMDHVPAACTDSNLRDLLISMFSLSPESRPTAAEVLASPYMNLQSQRELAARAAQISAEERTLQERCDAAAASESLLATKRHQVIKEQRHLHKQLAAAERAQVQAADDSADLRRLQTAAAEKTAELRTQVDKARKDQDAAAATHATLKRQQAKLKRLHSLAVAPAYWNARELDDAAPTKRIDVTVEMKERIKWLMNATAKPEFHGKGRDSHGAHFTTFEPTKVWRVENHQQWRSYVLRRDAVRANVGGKPARITPRSATASFRLPSGAQLDRSSNEHLLFHGTKPAAVDVLCNRGFDERVGSLGGLFGAGCYFAESSSKSDEYVPPGAKQYMFLCRVVVGSPFVTPNRHTNLRRPPTVTGHFDGTWPPSDDDRFDSLLATTKATDPSSFLARFREFVVYDHSQCYPEYLIEYKRK